MRLKLAGFALVTGMLLFGACAPASTTSGSGRSDLITREELEETGAGTLYEAIERLRPRWLTLRGQRSLGGTTDIVVYQNQSYLGSIDVLRQLAPDMVVRVRYLDAATASASLPGLGSRHIEGAIVIETSTN